MRRRRSRDWAGSPQGAAWEEQPGCQVPLQRWFFNQSLCHYTPELQETSEQAQSRFKSEKQSRRQLELKVTCLEEELADLRAEKESLEKVSSMPEGSQLDPSGQD